MYRIEMVRSHDTRKKYPKVNGKKNGSVITKEFKTLTEVADFIWWNKKKGFPFSPFKDYWGLNHREWQIVTQKWNHHWQIEANQFYNQFKDLRF